MAKFFRSKKFKKPRKTYVGKKKAIRKYKAKKFRKAVQKVIDKNLEKKTFTLQPINITVAAPNPWNNNQLAYSGYVFDPSSADVPVQGVGSNNFVGYKIQAKFLDVRLVFANLFPGDTQFPCEMMRIIWYRRRDSTPVPALGVNQGISGMPQNFEEGLTIAAFEKYHILKDKIYYFEQFSKYKAALNIAATSQRQQFVLKQKIHLKNKTAAVGAGQYAGLRATDTSLYYYILMKTSPNGNFQTSQNVLQILGSSILHYTDA